MWPHPTSGWRSQQIFLAHAALTDLHNRRFYTAEDIGRGIPELAGVDRHSDCIRIFLKNWSVSISPFGHALNTRTDDFSFHLNTEPLKAPVLHGNAGYSRKGISPESASCYYSYTRLKTEGTLEIGGKTLTVSGESWMDHEFSSAPLESDLAGWDWFSLQFDDGSELMLYFLRHKDGSYSPASSGTFVTRTGESAHLVVGDIGIEVLQNWKSPRSGAVYPSRWRLMVKNLGIDVQITTNLEDQEVETPGSTRVTYWEGSVSSRGTKHNQPISGHGYVELTGYARPFDAPM
jgi:predicted secreted hydrolase